MTCSALRPVPHGTVKCLPRLLGPHWLPQLQYFDCRTFLCDDQGHLLPHARRLICKKTNHWGYPNLSTWDELYQCCIARKQPKCEREICWQLADMPRYFKCRGPLAKCKEAICSPSDSDEAKAILHKDFEKLRKRAPPVIWILGYPQKSTIEQRKCFVEELTTKSEFLYIDLEFILCNLASKYFDFSPCPPKGKDTPGKADTGKNSVNLTEGKSGKTVEKKESFVKVEKVKEKKRDAAGMKDVGKTVAQKLPDDFNALPINMQRLVTLVKNVLVYRRQAEAFNTRGILEILKMAFLSFSDAKGYIVDSFPVNLTEAESFECLFWPVAAGVYFMSKKWSTTKGCNPCVVFPKLFLRSTEYQERVVEQTADAFAQKCLKVSNTECLEPADFVYMQIILADLIESYLRQCPPNEEVLPKTSSKKLELEKSTKTKKTKFRGEKINSAAAADQLKVKPKSLNAGRKGPTVKKAPRSSIPKKINKKLKSTVGMMMFENVQFGNGHFSPMPHKTKSSTSKEILEEVNANVMNFSISTHDLELNDVCMQKSEDLVNGGSQEDSDSSGTVITVKLRKNPYATKMDGEGALETYNESERSQEKDDDLSLKFNENVTKESLNDFNEGEIEYQFGEEVSTVVVNPNQSNIPCKNKRKLSETSNVTSKEPPLITAASAPNTIQESQSISPERNIWMFLTESIWNEQEVTPQEASDAELDEFQ